MTALGRQVRRFAGDDGGATAIEYGLIAALVAIGVLVALTTLGGGVTSLFDYVSSRSTEKLDARP